MTSKLSIEEKLTRSEKENHDLRHALEQSSILAVTDVTGKITFVNEKFCQISKYSRDELLGQNHRIINSGHHPKDFFTELWQTISLGRIWKGEVKNRAKDGTHYWVLTTIVPFLDEKGQPYQYVAIRTDITEEKLVKERAEEQRALLQHSEKMASLGEIAAGIAHELGTPLATIRGRMEFLQMQLASGRADKHEIEKTAQIVIDVADRMAGIIRAMRSLSRDGSQDPRQNVAIGQLIKDVLGFTWESFKKHGITAHIEEINENISVYCQETQISQVLINLINNAKDAIMPLAVKWIKIDVLDSSAAIVIAITDSGSGVPKELREKIMQPFFTTKDIGKGSGLGLSISKTIVEKHGGTLKLDPNSPHTRFVVTLPKRAQNF